MVWKQAVEENDDRKDFTQHECGRTFKAAQQTVADVKAAAEVISTNSVESKRSWLTLHQPTLCVGTLPKGSKRWRWR